MIQVVQYANTSGGPGTAITLAFPSPNQAGNLLLYYVADEGGNQSTTICTDTAGNTISNAISADTANERLDYVPVSIAGANTVSSHTSVSTRQVLHIWEISGIINAGVLDRTNTGASVTANISTAAAIRSPYELVFSAFYDNGAGGNPVLIPDPAAIAYQQFGAVSFRTNLTQVKISSTLAIQTMGVTGNGTDSMRMMIATFYGQIVMDEGGWMP